MFSQITIFISCLLALSCYTTGDVETNNCGDAVLDLYLIVDSSGSIKAPHFEEAKNALRALVGRLNVKSRTIGVTIINYSDKAIPEVSVSTVQDKQESQLIDGIDDMVQMGKGTSTGLGLKLAKDMCMKPDTGCRPLTDGAARAFILFTDGHSNDNNNPPQPIADAIRNSPIEGTLFGVGIGDIGADGQKELEALAGSKENVKYISSYLELTERINAISSDICDLPVFVVPDRMQRGAVRGNGTRYYKMRTPGKRALFEIDLTNKVGQSTIFVSTTNRKPGPAITRSVSNAGGSESKNSFKKSVPATAKYFYIAIRGQKPVNKFEFVVHISDV